MNMHIAQTGQKGIFSAVGKGESRRKAPAEFLFDMDWVISSFHFIMSFPQAAKNPPLGMAGRKKAEPFTDISEFPTSQCRVKASS